MDQASQLYKTIKIVLGAFYTQDSRGCSLGVVAEDSGQLDSSAALGVHPDPK